MYSKSVEDIFREAFTLYREGKFSEGYRLITSSHFEERESLQRAEYIRLCLAARMGDLELAESILEEALEKGFFYTEFNLKEDPDLAALQTRPGYQALVQRDLDLLQKAQQRARPELTLLEPERVQTGYPAPLLMALHGNNAGLQQSRTQCEFAVKSGWLTALPQSSQVAGEGVFGWSDHAKAQAEIKAHYAGIAQKYPLDEERTVIAGFSMGGYAAIEAVLRQTFPVFRFIGIGPYFGDLGPWQEWIRQASGHDLRGYLLLGAEDEPITTDALKFQKMLEAAGIKCKAEVFPGLGHAYPPDLEQVFERVVKFLFPK